MRDFTQWEVIGKGSERTCYQDPDDSSRCIKVSHKKNSKQSLREINYFKLLKKEKKSFSHIPQIFQFIEKDDLIGIEQEVILDDSKKISQNIYDYIAGNRTDDELNEFYHQLEILELYLIDNNIIPSDLVTSNLLVCNKNKELKVYIIDGFGGAEFLPLSNYIKLLGRHKIKRKWKKFMNGFVNRLVMKNHKEFYLKFRKANDE